jgi:hypothetical protein
MVLAYSLIFLKCQTSGDISERLETVWMKKFPDSADSGDTILIYLPRTN